MHASLLETDMLSEVLKRKNAAVAQKAQAYLQTYRQFGFSAFTRYEVVRGLKVKKAARQLGQFTTFCQHSLILAITDNIPDRAADLWVTAHHQGLPKRDADLIIAATALEHGLSLVTGNTPHFAWIAGLVLEDWRQP